MSDSDKCLTPMWIINGLRRFARGPMLDYCTEEDNPCGAESYIYLTNCGNEVSVGGGETPGFVWCNPPYSRGGKDLALSAIGRAISTFSDWAVLVPADHSTALSAMLEEHATYMGFFDRRIKFDTSRGGFRGKPTTARFSNVLYTNFPYSITGIRCYEVRRAEGDAYGVNGDGVGGDTGSTAGQLPAVQEGGSIGVLAASAEEANHKGAT